MIDPQVGLRNVGERLRRIRPEVFVGIPLAHIGRVVFGWGPRLIDKAIVVGEGSYFPGARTLASLRREAPAEPRRSDVGLSAGGTVVVPPIQFTRETPATTDSGAVLEVINECGVRSLFGSPVLLENLAIHAEKRGIEVPSLEMVIGGGAPITGPAMARLKRMMPNGEVYANYGATEALPSTAHSARETLEDTWAKTVAGQGICVGRPFSGVAVQIAKIQDDAATDFEALPTGEIGEILVRSPHICVGYFDDPESTRKNKIGPWHRIGDAGYLDAQGRLWVVGRVSQRVRGANGPLFSLLCEPIFDAHPKVRRSGLVGVADGTAEKAVICVETEPGVDRPSLRKELLALAAEHPVSKEVSEVLFIERLPVDPRHNSKIERPKLARWAAGRLKVPA